MARSEPLPSIDLSLFLTDPQRLQHCSAAVLLAVTAHPDTPRELLEILVHHELPYVAQTAQLHVNWAGELNQGWHAIAEEAALAADLGENDRLVVELLGYAPVPPRLMSEWVPSQHLIQGTTNPYTRDRYRIQLLERLTRVPELEPRVQIAESQETPLSVLEWLVGDADPIVRVVARDNPNCVQALVDLVDGQWEVASDWTTAGSRLADLGDSRWPWIRQAVAHNPSTLPATLDHLTVDTTIEIRLAVAENPVTPPATLETLSSSPEMEIQVAVAVHPNVNETTLHSLFSEHKDLLARRKDLPVGILERFVEDSTHLMTHPYLWVLLRQENTPDWLWIRLVEQDPQESRTRSIRGEILNHPQVPLELLQRWAASSDHQVQLAVAASPHAPEELKIRILETLATVDSADVRLGVATNSSTPPFILEALANQEFYRPRLLRTIRQSIEFPPEGESQIGNIMAYIRAVLDPAEHSIDLERWMAIVERPEIMEAMMETRYAQDTVTRVQSLMPRSLWAELLPRLSEAGLERVIQGISNVLATCNDRVRNSHHFRSISLALVGNPNLSVPTRDRMVQELEGRFQAPRESESDEIWVTRERLERMFESSPYQIPRMFDRNPVDENMIDLWKALAYNPAIPEIQRLDYFDRLLRTQTGLDEIARNPQTLVSILERLAEQGMVQVLAANPSAPVSILRQAAQYDNTITLERVASNPATPADLLETIALNTHDERVRAQALANPTMDALVGYRVRLQLKVRQDQARVNSFFATRPDHPRSLINAVESGDLQARLEVASNQRTPAFILERLAVDPDETVRSSVISNPQTPMTVLMRLAENDRVKTRLNLARWVAAELSFLPFQQEDVFRPLLEKLARDASEEVRLLIAQCRSVPPEILESLAQDQDYQVKRAVAGNPRTPTPVLEHFDVSAPPHTPSRIVADRIRTGHHIALAGNPNASGPLLARIAEETLASQSRRRSSRSADSDPLVNVARNPNTPEETLVRLSQIPSLIPDLAGNPSTPTYILELLLRDSFESTRQAVARREDTPTPLLIDLLDRAAATQELNRLQWAISERQHLPAERELWTRLIRAETMPTRARIWQRADMPLEILTQLVDSFTSEEDGRCLAFNPSLTPELLSRLADRASPAVRLLLMRHPHTTSQFWERLARDEARDVRQAVATREETSAELLSILAGDPITQVRQAVAANPNTTNKILAALAQDPEAVVRTAVARNTRTSPEILTELAHDNTIDVRRAVGHNPNLPISSREFLEDAYPQQQTSPLRADLTLQGLSHRYDPQSDDLAAWLTEQAQSHNAFVRWVVLLHPATPAAILREGAGSSAWLERYAVADNPSTPTAVRQQLARDGNRVVRATAQANRSETDET